MMNPLPPVTPELIDQVLHSENGFSRAEEIAKLSGNPYGVQVAEFDGARAVLFTKGKFRSKSRVTGDMEAVSRHLPAILELYISHGVPCRIPLLSHVANKRLISRFIEFGLKPESTGVTLIGRPDVYYSSSNPAVVAEEWDIGRVEDYIDLFLGADEVSVGAKDDVRDLERCEYKEPGLHFFIARLEGNPVAAGSIVINGKVGRLKSSATLPEFRKRGCQAALLKARFDLAQQSGCEYMIVGTGLHSASHRNLERFGMKIMCMTTTWKQSISSS